ncbi:MAG TPA: glutathione S-transferase N-terminal domain-containing protein [Methylomirabilota bacterium]|nr:glutathione S-transferase N-terminal domain-containing protein [Methylomirabilota bacterium]
MIELFQFDYSPYCIVQRRILEYSRQKFKIVDVPVGDRSVIWKLTRERYYQVPVLKDGREVLFETDDASQVIAKYIDGKFELGLFPREHEGVQSILWRFIENEVESATFRLNDIYYREFIPSKAIAGFVRHKERKFGRGCLEQWKEQQPELLQQLEKLTLPFEQMLHDRPFLLDQQPRFVDFDLFGMLGNFLFSGHYQLPSPHTRLAEWHGRMKKIKIPLLAREKLHS